MDCPDGAEPSYLILAPEMYDWAFSLVNPLELTVLPENGLSPAFTRRG